MSVGREMDRQTDVLITNAALNYVVRPKTVNATLMQSAVHTVTILFCLYMNPVCLPITLVYFVKTKLLTGADPQRRGDHPLDDQMLWFLPRCMECRHGIAMSKLSVCPSVCPSFFARLSLLNARSQPALLTASIGLVIKWRPVDKMTVSVMYSVTVGYM